MPTVAAPVIKREMDDWVKLGGSNSGIVGDANHDTGFHVGARYLSSSDYSRRRDPNGSDGPYVDWDYACAGDFSHKNNETLRAHHRRVLNGLMNGQYSMICEFIGKPWADRPVYYWARWNGIKMLQRYTGSGHTHWSHISWWRSRVDERAGLWVPATGGDDDVLTVPDGSPLLRRGSTGTAVRKLQEGLNIVGIKMPVDGDFGPTTESGVKTFQKRAKLSVDGVYGPNTAKVLQKEVNMTVFNDVWFTDKIPSPAADPGKDKNKYWAPANIIRSNNDHARKGLAEIRALASASKARDEAILGAVKGASTSEILNRINQHEQETHRLLQEMAEEQETRDMELMSLVRQAQSGELDAGEVVRLIGERLQAPVGTDSE